MAEQAAVVGFHATAVDVTVFELVGCETGDRQTDHAFRVVAGRGRIVVTTVQADPAPAGVVLVIDREQQGVVDQAFLLEGRRTEDDFLAEAEKRGLLGLKGHRSVGGMRASLYNAFPEAGVRALAELMRDFARRRG